MGKRLGQWIELQETVNYLIDNKNAPISMKAPPGVKQILEVIFYSFYSPPFFFLFFSFFLFFLSFLFFLLSFQIFEVISSFIEKRRAFSPKYDGKTC
jgi:hypothetical protein